MSKIFDSHCHPQFPQYDADREEMIKRNLEQGVFMIAVGANLETSKQAIELANKYDGPPSPDGFGRAGIWATVGLHPDDIKDDFKIEDYRSLSSGKKVVAIGEVGLDYYRTPEEEKRTRQKEIFSQFIDLALETDKPLVLHCRNEKNGKSAHEDAIKILSGKGYPSPSLQFPGVAHSFTGTPEEADSYLKLGFILAFNGIITFTEEYDELVKFLPMNKILIETDAPYLAPEPYRGQRNEPGHVIEVAKKIAQLKNMDYEMVAKETFGNTQKLFKIHLPPEYKL